MAIHDSYSSGKITYGIGFNVDTNSLNQLKSQLETITKMTNQDFLKINPNIDMSQAKQELKQVKESASQLQSILTKSFNSNLGSVNISKLRTELSSLNKTELSNIYNNLQKAGAAGTAAFNSVASAAIKSNLQLKESNSLLDKISTTFGNTVRYGISSSVFNRMVDSLSSAWNYTKALDSSLNDIRIVSGKSADEMERFAQQANKAAQRLGSNTKDYTNAALIYEQQGLPEDVVQARTEATIKAANVTGQSGREVSEQLTAVWNGYKVTAEESELYVDKLAKVAAGTAADLEELSTGMSKVASAAHTMGVDVDQLNAMLATVISVTREAPETIGTSFRTIFARLGDLKAGGSDEDGVGFGKVSSQLNELGISILDETGNMRDMGAVIEDIAGKWDNWTRAQKQAIAVAMAGKMQYSRFIALFDNWDQYTNALNMSKNAMGELQTEQDIYMESTSAHLKTLEAAWERVSKSFVDSDSTNGIIDFFTVITNGIANFNEALGSGGNILLTFGSIATQVFSKQIAGGINKIIENGKAVAYNNQQLENTIKVLKMQNEAAGGKDRGVAVRLEETQRLKENAKYMSNAQIKEQSNDIEDLAGVESEIQQVQQKQEQSRSLLQQSMDAYKTSLLHDLEKTTKEIINLENQAEGQVTRAQREEIERRINELKQEREQINQKIEQAKDFNSRDALGELEPSKELYDNASEYLHGQINEATSAAEGLKKVFSDVNEEARQSNEIVGELRSQLIDVEVRTENARNQFSSETQAKAELTEARTNYNRARRVVDNSDAAPNSRRYRDQVAIRDRAEQHAENIRQHVDAYLHGDERANRLSSRIEDAEQYQETVATVNQEVQKLLSLLVKVSRTEIITPEQNKSIKDLIERLQTLDTSGSVDTVKNELKDISASIIQVFKEIDTNLEQSEKNISDGMLRESQKREAILQQEAENKRLLLNQKLESQARQDTINGFVQMASSLGQISSSLMTIANIPKIWDNENLSSMEKTMQIIMALSTAIPMLTNGFITFGKNISTVTNSIQKWGSATTISIIAERAKNQALAEGYAAEQANAMATSLRSKMVVGETAAEWKAVAALTAKKLAMATLATLAVGVVVGAIYAVVKAYNAEQEAATKAAENAKTLSDSYNKAVQNYEQLKDSISQYENMQNALDTLIIGTKEWNDKLKESNHLVATLINSYPELAKLMVNQNGHLTLSTEGLVEAEKIQRQAVAMAEIVNNNAQNLSREANSSAVADNLYKTLDNKAFWTGVGDTIGDSLGAALIGLKAGGPIGAVIGGGIGAATGVHENIQNGAFLNAEDGKGLILQAAELFNKSPELFATTLNENGEKIATHTDKLSSLLGITNTSLINQIAANADSLKQLSASINTNTEATQALTEQNAHNYLSGQNNSRYDNYIRQDIIDKIMARSA